MENSLNIDPIVISGAKMPCTPTCRGLFEMGNSLNIEKEEIPNQLLQVVQRRPVHPRVGAVCECDSFSFQQYLLQYLGVVHVYCLDFAKFFNLRHLAMQTDIDSLLAFRTDPASGLCLYLLQYLR